MTAPSALELAGLAVDEANDAGGIGGRSVELVALDFGRSPQVVAAETVALHAAGAFDVLVGFHTSDVHRAVEAALAGRVRYVFTPPHEGGRRSAGVVRLGPAPREQHAAALAWVVRHRRARRRGVLGAPYLWPPAGAPAAAAPLPGPRPP